MKIENITFIYIFFFKILLNFQNKLLLTGQSNLARLINEHPTTINLTPTIQTSFSQKSLQAHETKYITLHT